MRYFLTIFLIACALTAAQHLWAANDVATHATLPTGLVSYWSLEETSGTREDAVGTNDLTDVNTVGYATGKRGNAADLENDNNESLSIADGTQSGLDITGSFSISLWIKPESFDENTPLVGKWQHATNNQYLLYLEATALGLLTDNSCSGYTYANIVKAHGMATGNWYMATVTYDSSSAVATFYVNATSIGTSTAQTPTNCSATFYLGDRHNNGVPQFDGLMDEVGIWSKALTVSEVTDLYNGGAGLPYSAPASSVFDSTIFEQVFW